MIGDALAGARGRNLRHDPALREAAVDDRVLDVLDRDRGVGDAEHAGAFARRGAGAARELREVVGLVQPVERVAPTALIDQVVPLRNQVVDRAAVVRLTERDAAVHAACALIAQMLLVGRRENLTEVADTLGRVPIRDALLRILHEASRLTHARQPVLSFSYLPCATNMPVSLSRSVCSISSSWRLRSVSTRL